MNDTKNTKKIEETTVIVGMSGGVDSSVCAAILKEKGYKVIGLFMKNWEEFDDNGVCNASKEYEDVVRVCSSLEIPYYSVEFVKEYKENVFNHFVEEYKAGHTPNPDILCNREIKFKVFLEYALKLGADFLATGHYCKKEVINGNSTLVKGDDQGKDQSYFLYTIKESILDKVMFPVGHIQKSEVREIAQKYDLATKNKKDSTGICFIGERNFKNFLSNYIQFKDGDFVNLKGEVVGRHTGAAYYTLGQRKGLGLGGPGEPWFVVDKDINNNKVVVERGDGHPALFRDYLIADELSFVGGDDFLQTLPLKLKAKIRYRQKDQSCTVTEYDNGELKVEFETPQKAITKRQSLVLYTEIDGHIVCLGGGMIKDYGPSYYEMGKELPVISND